MDLIGYADIECCGLGLYTDESPGLKVDPVVVLVLSLGFIFSVVALHGKPNLHKPCGIFRSTEDFLLIMQT